MAACYALGTRANHSIGDGQRAGWKYHQQGRPDLPDVKTALLSGCSLIRKFGLIE